MCEKVNELTESLFLDYGSDTEDVLGTDVGWIRYWNPELLFSTAVADELFSHVLRHSRALEDRYGVRGWY